MSQLQKGLKGRACGLNMGLFTTRGAVLTALVAVLLYAGIGHDSQYVFTAESMHEIANAAIKEGNGDLQTTFDLVVSKLNTTYPKYVIVALDSSLCPIHSPERGSSFTSVCAV